ncbi:MAG: hypothetical protein LBV69_11055 [Bacteroidales bacterium]|jgi:hypothetical protein|nr:hypothetical protein [Bacteroidales bacterium]
MKKILFSIVLFLSFCVNCFSQVEYEDKEKEGAGFVSVLMTGTMIDKQFGFMIGGGGGFIVKKIRIGVFYEGLVSKVSLHPINSVNTYKFAVSYGGLWVGYPLWSSKKFHALTDLKICFGTTSMRNATNVWEESDKNFLYGFIPYIGGEYYITEHFAVCLGVDYRLCFFPKNPENHKQNILNFPSIRLGIKLGIF